jgi:hypothetical protein
MRTLFLFCTLFFAGLAGAATADITAGPCDAPLGIVCRLGTGQTTPGGASNQKASHAGWPRVTGVYWVLPASGGGGKATDRNDELLGNHGDDVLNGGPGKDILWGDMLPTGNNSWQHDELYGGSGNDFIYASHGHNIIKAGAGNDVVHAHYGRGTVDCGKGIDLLYLSHRRRHAWKVRNCERITFHAGLTPLTSRG